MGIKLGIVIVDGEVGCGSLRRVRSRHCMGDGQQRDARQFTGEGEFDLFGQTGIVTLFGRSNRFHKGRAVGHPFGRSRGRPVPRAITLRQPPHGVTQYLGGGGIFAHIHGFANEAQHPRRHCDADFFGGLHGSTVWLSSLQRPFRHL